MKKRKTVALILAAAMISSLIPAKNLTVQAENYQISAEKSKKNGRRNGGKTTYSK